MSRANESRTINDISTPGMHGDVDECDRYTDDTHHFRTR
ncbi:hypothetical protein GFS60_07150 (plasmid) [Rhodococcus sp. WAY2]|nr:hypothetical protein GFS60_07150 [Rhodococcus sp. WAY2]